MLPLEKSAILSKIKMVNRYLNLLKRTKEEITLKDIFVVVSAEMRKHVDISIPERMDGGDYIEFVKLKKEEAAYGTN